MHSGCRNRGERQTAAVGGHVTTPFGGCSSTAADGIGKKDWQNGWVKYKNQIYAYNEDILTFLFMGIDKQDETVQEMPEGTDGGQADALFLLVLNPRKKEMDLIGINRNTMTQIDMYSDTGAYIDTITAQICVQHGFGNGMEESCVYQKEAVSRLFYGLPIHGYAAVNYSAAAP